MTVFKSGWVALPGNILSATDPMINDSSTLSINEDYVRFTTSLLKGWRHGVVPGALDPASHSPKPNTAVS